MRYTEKHDSCEAARKVLARVHICPIPYFSLKLWWEKGEPVSFSQESELRLLTGRCDDVARTDGDEINMNFKN
jgi:hypothetical protein